MVFKKKINFSPEIAYQRSVEDLTAYKMQTKSGTKILLIVRVSSGLLNRVACVFLSVYEKEKAYRAISCSRIQLKYNAPSADGAYTEEVRKLFNTTTGLKETRIAASSIQFI